MYGKPNGLAGVEELLHSITEVKKVSVYNSISCLLNHLAEDDTDMIFIDADDDITDWRYVVQRFRDINDRTKIVLMSNNSDQSVRAYEAGVFDYLLKPVNKKQIKRVVSKELIAT